MISVIIPMYNSRKTIGSCLQSIMDQTYDDLEIIVVDDGSMDNGGEIVQEMASRDGRIRYIRKNNGGVSSARNRGIDECHGEYICFVDSDDTVTTDYISSMYTTMMETKSDIVMCGYLEVYKDKISYHVIPKNVFSTLQGKMVTDFFTLSHFAYSPCLKVFRTEIINQHHLRFREDMVLAEDQHFNYRYYAFCKSIAFVNAPNYIYVKQDASLSSAVTVQTFLNEAENLVCMANYIESNGIEKGEKIVADYLCYCVWRYIFIPGESNTKADALKRLKALRRPKIRVKMNNWREQMIFDLIYYRMYTVLYFLIKGRLSYNRSRRFHKGT